MPRGGPLRRSSMSFMAPTIWVTPRLQFSKKRSPSRVRFVVRVVRRNRRVLSCSSSFCTLRETAERPMPSRSPARTKLPSVATAMNAMMPA
ncbi:hypothetical protein D3C81_1631300 [compost metagenome]